MKRNFGKYLTVISFATIATLLSCGTDEQTQQTENQSEAKATMTYHSCIGPVCKQDIGGTCIRTPTPPPQYIGYPFCRGSQRF